MPENNPAPATATARAESAEKELAEEKERWIQEREANIRLKAECVTFEEKLVAAKEQLEFDRTTCHNFIQSLDKALDGRFWLTEGRGSYAWDDDRYREEFHDAAVALRAILDPMRKMAQNLSSRLPTTEAVMNARVDLRARAEAAEKELTEANAQINAIIDQYGEKEEDQSLAQVVNDVYQNGLEGWGRAGDELEKRQIEEHERDAATVHVNALREALEKIRLSSAATPLDSGDSLIYGMAAAALARTPAQSLAEHDVELLRKVIAEADKRRNSIIMAFGDVSAGDILGIVTEMIERIEAEAKGKSE